MPNLDSKSNEVFVRLPDEIKIRTDVLEAAKFTTQLVKNAENLQNILRHKKKEKFKLKLLFSEIRSLADTLQFQDLPLFEQKEELQKKELREIKKSKEDEIKEIKKDKLTQELEEIERKLNSLKF